MPSVSHIIQDSNPPHIHAQWREEIQYVSPNGEHLAVFHNPEEFHMGATSWKIEIRDAGSGSRRGHPFLGMPGAPPSFRHFHPYAPWAGETLLVSDWGDSDWASGTTDIHLYSIREKTAKTLTARGILEAAVGSRDREHYVIVTSDRVMMLSADGLRARVLEVPGPWENAPYVGFMRGSAACFVLHGATETVRPGIRFFDGASGRPLGGQTLDPDDLLPWDRAQYDEVPREYFSLQADGGLTCVGNLLDRWGHVHADDSRDSVHICLYRPSGSVYREEGRVMCPVEERWVELKLAP